MRTLARFAWGRAGPLFIAFVALASFLPAQDYTTDKPPPTPEVSVPLTDEQKTALHAVDVRLAGVEAIAAKIDDPDYRKSTDSAIVDLKRRRKSLEKNFDAGLYESLMHSVISRYQITALWLAPPPLPAPAPAKPKPANPPPAAAEKKPDAKPPP